MQAPGNWLNYNRYAYCYGNPFKYTDPDGEFPWLVIGIVTAVSYLASAHANTSKENQGNPLKWNWNPVSWFKKNNPNQPVLGAYLGYGDGGLYGGGFAGNPNMPVMGGYSQNYGFGVGGQRGMYYPGYEASLQQQARQIEKDMRQAYAEQQNFEDSWKFHLNQALFDFSNMDNYFDVAEATFDLYQKIMAPALSSVNQYSDYMSLYRGLGNASGMAGTLGTGAEGLGLVFDYSSMKAGNMSRSRFGYHAASFGASYGIGSVFGPIPGILTERLFWAGEVIYDHMYVPALNMYWQLEQRLRTPYFYMGY